MTREEFNEWKTHPLTEQVFAAIRQVKREQEEKSVLFPTMEATFRAAAVKEGVLQGLDALMEMEVWD